MRKHIIRGFTLIELLVVIAIIAVLASVILASLNSARSKGGDAAIKANLDSIRSQAELYYSDNNSYAPVTAYATGTAACLTQTAANNVLGDPTIVNAMTSAKNASGPSAVVTCAAGTGFYAIAVQEKVDTTKAWCISSSGSASEITNASALTAGNSCL